MPKVLLITYKFPPSMHIGVQRSWGLAKYLPDFGWDPVVLTPRVPGRSTGALHLVETDLLGMPAMLRRRSKDGRREHAETPVVSEGGRREPRLLPSWLTALAHKLIFPDPLIVRWYLPAVRAAGRFLRDEPVDAIWSTTQPYTASFIGRRLKQLTGRPWIADLRDLWTGNKGTYYNTTRTPLRRFLDLYCERWTLGPADAITILAEPFVERLQAIHPGKLVLAVPSGYDPDDFAGHTYRPMDKFVITYTGTVRQYEVGPVLLFEAVAELILEGVVDPNRMVIRFYGKVPDKLSADVKRLGLEAMVDVQPRIPHAEVVRQQIQSTMLLLLDWADPDEVGVSPGKVYEYLGAKRPILTLGRKGLPTRMERLMDYTRAGVYVTSVVEAKAVLARYYTDFIERGQINYTGDATRIEEYSMRAMAAEFAKVLDQVYASSSKVGAGKYA